MQVAYSFKQCRRVVTVRELARLQGFEDDYTFHSEGGNVKTVGDLHSGPISTYKMVIDASANWKCCSMACGNCNWPTVYPGTFTPEEQPGTRDHWQHVVPVL